MVHGARSWDAGECFLLEVDLARGTNVRGVWRQEGSSPDDQVSVETQI